MRYRSFSSTLLLTSCMLISISQLVKIFSEYFASGFYIEAFLMPEFSLTVGLVVCTLLMAIFLLINNFRAFYVVFAVYALLEFADNLILYFPPLVVFIDLPEAFASYPVLTLYEVNAALMTLLIGIYAILYLISLIMYFTRSTKLFKLTNNCCGFGIAVAVGNILTTVLSYAVQGNMFEMSFGFLDIFFDLLVSLLFSLIYIYTPKHLQEIY